MLIQTWLIVTAAGIVTTGLVITRRLPAVIGALAGIIMLVIAAFGALNLEVATSCCVYERDPNQPLAFLALGGVVVNVVFLLADATGQLPTAEDRGAELPADGGRR